MAPVRQSRAQTVANNDRALRNAVTELALESGWDALTFSGIATRAGLTVGAIYGRAENSTELGIDLWQQDVEPWLSEATAALNSAGRAGDSKAMLRQVVRWETEATAALAVEMLVAALFDADFGEVLIPDALRILSPWCLPATGNDPVTATQAAAGVLNTSFAFGRAIAKCAGVVLPTIGRREAVTLVAHHLATPSRAPRSPRHPLRWVAPMADGDDTSQAVARGTVQVLGRVGYKRATIARIARESGVPRGSILSQLPDKAALVARSARLGLIPPGEVWSQYAPMVSKHGPLLARAFFLEEFLRPENRPLWAVNLELARVSRFIPELREFCPGNSILEQTHLGVMLTACLVPGIAKLPFADPFSAGSTT
jgi:AcrR family transcriptional regulator